MNQTFMVLASTPVSFGQALEAAAGLIALLLLCLAVGLSRARGLRLRETQAATERQRELEQRMSELARSGAELHGRMQSMAEALGARQVDLARVMAERLDTVSARVGAGLESHAQTTGANLNKLNERLAVIDAAQGRLTSLTQEVVSLKDILSNKQARGAFGQGRMEAIVRDGLPPGAYDFQFTLSNKSRPDCVIRLPGDARLLAVDAKFPLEAFTLLKDARSDEARKVAFARVRTDVGKHVKDIAERYLLAGETQDLAMMFVPSESVYSDLVEHFDDVVQKAHRAKVILVSPSLLMMAVQVMQTIVRDGLPSGAYDFQFTLSNKSRPECVIRLPGDARLLAVDAKFPLEAFTLFKDARSDEARKVALARVRADVGKHVKDIAERYLLAGETQDIAVMFVPSESVYSDLVEHFDDVVQKAHRGKVIIVSPSLLMMAIQVMQTIVRDARMRDQAHVIQAEVGKLLEDVRRLAERTGRLDQHFRQAQEDVGQIVASSEKIVKRGERIDTMEFAQSEPAPKIEALPHLRLAKGGE